MRGKEEEGDGVRRHPPGDQEKGKREGARGGVEAPFWSKRKVGSGPKKETRRI